MPKLNDTPEKLKPYIFHRMELKIGSSEAVGQCPFCDKESKFYVSVSTGMYSCKSCAAKGNDRTFLRELHKQCAAMNGDATHRANEKLAEGRGLLQEETLIAWGICRSTFDTTWLVPGYN